MSMLVEQALFSITLKCESFCDGFRVVMLIDRGVQNSNKGSRRWINKIITTNRQEWVSAVSKLLYMQEYIGNPDIRLYSCINDRKIDKAINLFQHRQLDLLSDMKAAFYSRINDSFSSCLMKPENKNSKYFLLDVDSKEQEEVDDFIEQNNIQIKLWYETKNGWHFIVDPFNVTLADGAKTFTVNKDGLMLLHYMDDNKDA